MKHFPKALALTLALLVTAVQVMAVVHSVSDHHISVAQLDADDSGADSFGTDSFDALDHQHDDDKGKNWLVDCPQCHLDSFTPLLSASQSELDFRDHTEPPVYKPYSFFTSSKPHKAIRAPPAHV